MRNVPTDLFDPAVELVTPISSVAGKPYRGYAGVEEWIRENDEQFSVWRISLPDLREADGKVIAIGSVHARTRRCGPRLSCAARASAGCEMAHKFAAGYAVDAVRRTVECQPSVSRARSRAVLSGE